MLVVGAGYKHAPAGDNGDDAGAARGGTAAPRSRTRRDRRRGRTFRRRFRAKRGQLQVLPHSQGQNVTLTVLTMPCLLDSVDSGDARAVQLRHDRERVETEGEVALSPLLSEEATT